MPCSVLICGFGAFGRVHAEAWRQCDPAIRLYVSDPSEAARLRALHAGIPADQIATAPEALIGNADIVDVVAPPAYHLPLALLGLRADKPVLIEKPAVSSTAEAEQLMAQAANRPIQIGMVLRCHPLVTRMRALLSEGAIGRLVAIEGDFSGWKRMRPDSSLLENDGVHFLDLMRFFAGSAARTVDARAAAQLGGPVPDDIRIEVGFDGGVAGRLRLGVLACGSAEDPFVPGALTTKSFRLIGTEGNLLVDFNANRLTRANVSYVPSPGGYDVNVGPVVVEAAFGITPVALLALSFRRFLDALAKGTPMMCSAEEGALEMAQLLATVETALRGSAPSPLPVPGGSE